MMLVRRLPGGWLGWVVWLVAGGRVEGWVMGALLDRAGEIAALDGGVAAARGGVGGGGVGGLWGGGGGGIGKTARLGWAAGQARDVQRARVAGVQAEMGLGFAGLHQLLVPFVGGLGGLPPPQRQALGSAFGLV